MVRTLALADAPVPAIRIENAEGSMESLAVEAAGDDMPSTAAIDSTWSAEKLRKELRFARDDAQKAQKQVVGRAIVCVRLFIHRVMSSLCCGASQRARPADPLGLPGSLGVAATFRNNA